MKLKIRRASENYRRFQQYKICGWMHSRDPKAGFDARVSLIDLPDIPALIERLRVWIVEGK